MRARRGGLAFIFAATFAAVVGSSSITANSTRDRTISLYNIHTHETLTILYMKGGRHVPEAMRKINWILRDWRKDETIEMDPDLIDLLWEIHNELGSAEPIHVISGYRSRDTNELLRKAVGGQASQSRHILGKAADVHFPDVPVRKLRYSALIRERGGVGYYPTSAIPFVHVDTDRVRAWPRLPRAELALLFPSGRTQHLPADGEPLTKEDVRQARVASTELATQIAAFHELRARPHPPVQVASLMPPLPQLLAPPRLAERPTASGTRPSDAERARLAQLAEAPPKLVAPPALVERQRTPDGAVRRGEMRLAAADPIGDLLSAANRLIRGATLSRETTFVPAPAYDDEHPEELSYRPFPIAPLLTASADDATLAQLVHPDLGRILELIDQSGSAPTMRLRPGTQQAELMWAQQFKGEAVNFLGMFEPSGSSSAGGLASRRVHTQPQ